LWLTLHTVRGLVLVLAALGTLVQVIRLRGGGRITLAMSAYVALLYRTGIATPVPKL